MHTSGTLFSVCFILYPFSHSYFDLVLIINVYYQEHRKKMNFEKFLKIPLFQSKLVSYGFALQTNDWFQHTSVPLKRCIYETGRIL